jgi:hypothetical protein
VSLKSTLVLSAHVHLHSRLSSDASGQTGLAQVLYGYSQALLPAAEMKQGLGPKLVRKDTTGMILGLETKESIHFPKRENTSD